MNGVSPEDEWTIIWTGTLLALVLLAVLLVLVFG